MGENAQKRVKAYYRKEEMIEKYRKMYQEVEEADGRNRIELKNYSRSADLQQRQKRMGMQE